jgi:hypothetical protein
MTDWTRGSSIRLIMGESGTLDDLQALVDADFFLPPAFLSCLLVPSPLFLRSISFKSSLMLSATHAGLKESPNFSTMSRYYFFRKNLFF